MTLEDLFHRELSPSLVLDVPGDHVGAKNGVSARRLVRIILGIDSPMAERCLRHVIVALREAGHPIAGTPATGYFLAETDAELEATCEFLYSRAMTTLTQVAALKRVALPDLRGQLRLPVTHQEHSHVRND
ncbi:MAG TPA: hypothetical protein VFN09_06640 [Rhodanobacteraceae bacterium]|nr:hypothetical protein [Rhodanobacteraceae bacterium]